MFRSCSGHDSSRVLLKTQRVCVSLPLSVSPQGPNQHTDPLLPYGQSQGVNQSGTFARKAPPCATTNVREHYMQSSSVHQHL